MSDIAPPTPAPEAPETPPVVTDTPPAAPETPPAAPAVGIVIPEDLDADLPEGVDKFDRPYVERLRREAAERRTRLKPFEETFGEASDEEREALLELNKLLLTNPEAGTRRMIELSRALAGDRFDEFLQAEPTPLTAEDAQRIWEENQAKAAAVAEQQRAEQEVFAKIKDLGYEENSPEAANLVWRAYNQFDGDMDKAHEAVQADVQAIIDAYVQSKAGKNASFPPVATGGGGPADPAGGAPKNFQDARAAAEARLAAQAGQ